MSEKPNNCLAMNMFTSKLKELLTEFNSLLLVNNFQDAKILQKKIEKISQAAKKFTSVSAGYSLEQSGEFAYVDEFVEGTAMASKGNIDEEFLINSKGEVIIEAQMIIYSDNGGYIVKEKDGKAYFTNFKGERISEIYEDITSKFVDGMAIVRENDIDYYLDKSYSVVLDDFGYKRANPFSDGYAWVMPYGRNADFSLILIDKTGKQVLDEKFDKATAYSEGKLGVERNVRHGTGPWFKIWQYMDIKGEKLFYVQIRADASVIKAHPFHEGMARIEYKLTSGTKYATYINDKGEKNSSDSYFSEAEDFNFGYGRIREADGKYYFIDKTGQKAFGGRSFEQWDKFDKNGLLKTRDLGKPFMDTQGKFYTNDEMSKKLGILVTPEDVKEFIEKVEANK